MKRLFGILSLFMIVFNYIITDITSAASIEELEGILNSALDEVIKDDESNDIVPGIAINSSREIAEIKTSTLLPGQEFNIAIKSLTYGESSVKDNTYFNENKITKFIKYNGTTLPDNKIVISVSDAVYPVYSWFDNTNGTLYYYSEADKIYFNEDSSCMFRNFISLNEINFHDFDLSRVVNMEAIFYGAGLKNLDLSYMDLSNVTNTQNMFQSNNSIEHVNFEGINMSKLSSFGSRPIFYDLNSLRTVNLSGANFSGLVSSYNMFAGSNNLTGINMAYSNFSSITSAGSMFDCSKLENLNLSYSKFNSLTTDIYFGTAKNVNLKFADFRSFIKPYSYNSLFGGNNEEIDLEGTNFSSIQSMKYWFQSKDNLIKLNFSGTILSSLTDMSYMFQSITNLDSIDFSHTDLSNVTTMEEMFSSSYGIKYVNFSGSNLSNLNNAKQMFNAAKNLTGVNFHGAILTGLTNVEEMFNSSYPHEELFNVDFGEVKFGATLNSMFKYSRINTISFSGADFTNVIDAGKLFYNIPTLLKIDFTNIKGANNITNMESMFYSDELLTGVDLSNFDLGKVKNMYGMFQSCKNLKNINFGNRKIKPEGSLHSMFENNYSLKNIDLSNFDTSEVTDMSYMFASANSIDELDLSSFDTSIVSNMDGMFGRNRNLKTIYVSDRFVTSNTTSSDYMFKDDVSLVGGNGTTYNSNNINSVYAKIDSLSTSGYFTDILDREYEINYIIDTQYVIGEQTITDTYTPRRGVEFKKAAKPGYELEYWYESGHNEAFIVTESTKGDKTLYPKWKALKEKAQETASESVVYINETTVTIGDDIQEEPINNSSTINLVSKEVEQHEIKEEDDKTTIQESEIQVTSDKKVEYQGGLEVYLEKTTNIGEKETKERIEGTAKFSSPVAVKIPITSNTEAVKVQVKHGGEDFGYTGLTLNPYNECINGEAVNDKYNGENVGVIEINGEKYALIYTCSASTFVAYTENAKPEVVNESTSTPTPAAGGGRIISSTTNKQSTNELEHSSADAENKSVEQNTTTQTKEITIDSKLQQRSLTRGEVAVMTNILLDVYPQLVEGKQEIDDITNACSNYADELNFTKAEKKAITRLCKLSIMGIHADNIKPLDKFMVNQDATNDEFSKVINRSISTYNEKDLSVIKEALKKLEDNEENVEFGTVYNVFMSIKSLFN